MQLYNSMSKQVEPFEPLDPRHVKLYTCGPTVYNYAHIGNLRTYIHEDILEKTLVRLNFGVDRVMNITDVGHLESDADDGEDKMLKGAQREKKTVWEVAAYYTDAFFRDCEKLKIKRPETVAKVTDYIGEFIAFIKVLESKGYTYFANGNVYFDISKFEDYTALSKMDLDQLRVAMRDDVEEDVFKRNPQDFVLWFTKSKFDNQAMKWDSPWGVGYPGWHIECSVIAIHLLGPKLDIHCGGVDHIPVHHTNEIAQSESYTGDKWTRYWWHSEFLIDQTGKMSKSSGEFLTVSLLESKGYKPLAYRYYVLNSHYRKQLTFTFDSLKMAEQAYEKLLKKTQALIEAPRLEGVISKEAQSLMDKFDGHLANDLNTANAITVLYEVLKSTCSLAEKRYLVALMDEVLSLGLLDAPEALETDADEVAWIASQLEARTQAKQTKDWAKADAIRKTLQEKGIVITDTPEGAKWHRES